MDEKISDIFTKRATGLCECCDYGFDKCIKDGEPYCERETEEVNEDEQQESV